MLLPQLKKKDPVENQEVVEKPKKSSETERIAYDERIEIILKRAAYLRSMNPSKSDFLGADIHYPVRKRRWFGNKKVPDINGLRDSIIQTLENKSVIDARKSLNNLLKAHPFEPNLRVLKAIQLMNDTSQSGLDEKRLDVLKKALIETAIAIHNNGLSVFNATWLVKIYLKYLETLHRRVSNEYQLIAHNFHWQIRKAADDLQVQVMHLTSMMAVKKHISGLTILNTKLKGSAYIYGCIPKEEITEAANIMSKGEMETTSSGWTANYVIWVALTLASLFARIPLLHKLVMDILSAIPDVSHDLILQKKMVGTVARAAEYQVILATGDTKSIQTAAMNIYARCGEIIKQYLGGMATFKRTYEIDPFLKAAWITKELQGILDPSTYRPMLEESLKRLNLVLQSTEEVKDSIELATKLRDDLEEIMLSYGWSPFELLKN